MYTYINMFIFFLSKYVVSTHRVNIFYFCYFFLSGAYGLKKGSSKTKKKMFLKLQVSHLLSTSLKKEGLLVKRDFVSNKYIPFDSQQEKRLG